MIQSIKFWAATTTLLCLFAPGLQAIDAQNLKKLAEQGRWDELVAAGNQATAANALLATGYLKLARIAAEDAASANSAPPKAESEQREGSETPNRVAGLNALGVVLTDLDPDAADKAFLQAEAAAAKDDYATLAAIRANRAALLVRSDQTAALKAIGSAAAAAAFSNDRALIARIGILFAQITDDQDTSAALWKSAANIVWRAPDSVDKLSVLLALATRDDADAARHADEAYQLAKRLGGKRGISQAAGIWAEKLVAKGDHKTALSRAREALFVAQSINAPDLQYQWDWLIARIKLAQGKDAEAVAMLEAAVNTLSPIRNDLARHLWRRGKSFRDAVGPLYLQLADLYLRRANGDQAKLRQVRALLERFRSHELEDYFRDECVNVVRQRARSLETLPKGVAALYVVPLENRLELLLGIGDRLSAVSVEIPDEEFQQTVRDFRTNLETRTTNRYLTQSRQLYKWLITPIAKELASANVDTLVFVPDGILRTVPLGALQSPDKKFLVQEYALAVSPGMTLLDEGSAPKAGGSILTAGLVKGVQGYPALPNVESELNAIFDLYGSGSDRLQDESFVQPNIAQSLNTGDYTVVHLATHGEFGGNASDSFVLTYDGRLNLDELRALLEPRRYRGTPVDLLCLSACRTAAGDERAALGLAGVGVKAGARSVLATLWYVNDESSSKLIQAFYAALAENKGKAHALQVAQTAVLTQRRYKHPYYWAPFLLIGTWD